MAFCTTYPPSNPKLLPYTCSDSYELLVLSLGVSFGDIVVGSALVVAIARSSSDWFRNVRLLRLPRVCV